MGGGLIQIVAYGAQDIYLTGNPQITFFKVVYKRHTNFAIESIEQTFNGSANFGSTVTCELSRNGDLVNKVYLQVELPGLDQTQTDGAQDSTFVHWVNSVGNAMIKKLELFIGGQLIDSHYGEWLDIWSELNVGSDQKLNYQQMVGYFESNVGLRTNSASTSRYYVPLQFFFNRNAGLALPLIALQYHEVVFKLEIESLNNLVRSDVALANPAQDTNNNTATITSCSLWVDYIYLDTDERRRFAQISHEYLIEQVQHLGSDNVPPNATSKKVDINYNHPVKSIHWVIQDSTYLASNTLNTSNGNQKLRYVCSSNNVTDTFETAKLVLNNSDRFKERNADYFRLVQNYQHSKVAPSKTIYSYSFGLKHYEHQPSGSCNFSRLDSSHLFFTFNAANHTVTNTRTVKVYAVNYNVLRIMSGMGGVAFSN
jgi:hypothetical protein